MFRYDKRKTAMAEMLSIFASHYKRNP